MLKQAHCVDSAFNAIDLVTKKLLINSCFNSANLHWNCLGLFIEEQVFYLAMRNMLPNFGKPNQVIEPADNLHLIFKTRGLILYAFIVFP
jgi:hypothetical protein